MKIRSIRNSERPGGLEITAVITEGEFEQLLGDLHELRLFSRHALKEPASAIRTGARHSYAKYLLLPVRLRRRFRADTFDFTQPACGAILNENLYVVYEIPRVGFSKARSGASAGRG